MDRSKWTGILVYIELRHGGAANVSLELIGKAQELARKSGDKIYGAAIGEYTAQAEEQLARMPLEALYIYETQEGFQADIYEEAFLECIQEIKPSIVLIGGTIEGRAMAPRIAVALRTGVTADCTELRLDEENQLVQIRPAFGGNIMASILTPYTRPQIATVRPGVFTPSVLSQCESGKIRKKKLISQRKRVLTAEKTGIVREAGIDSQKILVVAGRGVRKKEDLEMLRELAGLLGGKLASSRALVEKGWTEPQEQIGLSGTTVRPLCMLTFGVSGTVQFMAGMKNTPNIIAVNTDPQARIFEIAHYPVCADLYEVVPQLIKRLRKN